jgi:tetratricopeptide (TPR) repeat protein
MSLKHLVFFETLAETDEGSARWKCVTGGLVVLRLLDTWYDLGAQSLLENKRGVRNLRGSLDEMPQGPQQKILHSIVDHIEKAEHPDMSEILPRLNAYARVLSYESEFRIARDVFQSIIDYTPESENVELTDLHMQMGYCSRMLMEWEEAASCYAEAGQLAAASGDTGRMLRAQIADARLAIDRGNLAHSEALLDDVIARASDAGELAEIKGLAMHERAAVAYMRRDFERSLKFAWEAMPLMRHPTAKDRLLTDISSALAELGLLEAAKTALSIVADTADEQYLRWVAGINLVGLLASLGDEEGFVMRRDALASAELTPALEASYHLSVGRGYCALGNLDHARTSLERAAALAQKHGFHQVNAEAEKSLLEMGQETSGSTTEAPTVAPTEASEHGAETVRIARAIEDMGRGLGD